MPIYHKTPPPSTVGNHNTAEIDYHTSEAAKVKRTREQAYFNSYDFDAIEVLPYDEEEDDDADGADADDDADVRKVKGQSNQSEREQRQSKSIQIRQQQNKASQQLTAHHQQQQMKPQQISNHSSSTLNNSFMVDNRQQSHRLHHVNSKYNPSMYLQRLSGIFASKTNNNNNNKNNNRNPSTQQMQQQQQQQKQQQQQQQHRNQRHVAGSVCGVDSKDISIAVAVNNAPNHDNKHLKLSSSKTSSTSLCSSSMVEEILTADNVCVGSEVIVTGSALLPLECARDVTAAGIGTRTTTSDTTPNMNIKPGGLVACTSATAAASATTANFLLPRAMFKYQSSTLNTQQQGAVGITAGTTNSMPLATNANSTSSSNSPTNISRQQQQQQRDVHKLETIKGKNAIMPTLGSTAGLRLKKTSSSSSVITSLASEDIEEDRDLEENEEVLSGRQKKEQKVLPKIINTKVSARASSHQSHYSTDKSASSGYYSSNVCSTYSLEEHIYSEPTLDIKKLRNNAKDNKLPIPAATLPAVATTHSTASTLQTNSKLQQQQQQQQQRQVQQNGSLLSNCNEAKSVMRSLDKNGRYRFAENDSQALASNRNSQEFNENLKILESSIENLDRHLKSFPGANSQEALVSYTQNPYNPYASVNHNDKLRHSSSYHQLPTIQESHDVIKKQTWPEDRSDDSLRDIDLDSFLLDKDKKLSQKSKPAVNKKGVDNPTFLTDEQEENHYKCAKYINSCPEDAYRVESDIIAPARSSISGQSVAVSVDLYPKRYEDQLHFQNTRELLEDVRDKIRLLTQTQEAKSQAEMPASNEEDQEDYIPKELHIMINTLKQELESYLERMNQHSEQEIRQLCTGLVKNQHIVKMKNAFERRRSSVGDVPDIYSTYEAVQDGIVMTAQGVPISITQQITSIRCSSDPNFKMKRKSLTEVFPLAECYVESLQAVQQSKPLTKTTQLQRNLSYQKPVLDQLKPSNANVNLKGNNNNNSNNNTSSASGTASGGDSSEPNDKDSILDWHRKKPSIWELYYGTNRIQQSLLGGKKNGTMVATASASSPSTMCYPSSRPESDFTLDLPRAEQLRIKMEKEKKFRQRCRVITTFLSLVFFLLTVMVVSLVLTRGKRMFGSMI